MRQKMFDRILAWNGVRLSIPGHWEARVAAPCHLIFEAEFQPLLQLRWYQQSGKAPAESQRLAAALAKQGEMVEPKSAGSKESNWAEPWRQLESKFQVLAFSAEREKTVSGGAFSCPHCHTLFHFQTFPDKMAMGAIDATGKTIAEALATLSCHDHDEDLYRIQDFSLSLPPGFRLADYSFAPGLTRLSFAAGQLRLTAARLAPADDRLRRQSLAEILLAQTGVADLQIRETGERNSCEGFRDPTIFSRLLLSLRRDRPFVRARISHDPLHDRLLSLILSGARPLPAGLLPEIAEGYAIV